MITDPWFYAAAVPAVLIFGISKGGFGGGLGLVAVPLMTLAIGPRQAAAILLPILCVMDLFGAWAYRGRWDRPIMAALLPGALVGIGVVGLVALLTFETPGAILLPPLAYFALTTFEAYFVTPSLLAQR